MSKLDSIHRLKLRARHSITRRLGSIMRQHR
jgi:hypothetical protein